MSEQTEKKGGAGCLPVKSMSFPQQYHHPPQNLAKTDCPWEFQHEIIK
ncbi:hypothetical protein ABIC12_002838 [Pantoea agglomerans]|jgi:hypothetical protein|nr:hypothetical protein [Pantoea agglomerans]MDQ0431183.1 hypothetical protein [Pantoea agglomerans]NEG84947.1 hypothetical protein [Pantoea agglomerans]NEH09763.1 hypothetical protein [Pantoea agglomerans]